jgi:tRNA nucleotidyltransferase/poly(A) polymerase
MLYFDKLEILDKHQAYLQKKLQNDNIFLVGGCIRDLLLGINDDPKDIDLTMAGDPIKIYNALDKKDISHFITEKFGTMTLISKDSKKSEDK